MRKLYPFQDFGVEMLMNRQQVLLADDMGLGKTAQTSVALKLLFASHSIRRAIIVCPTSLCLNWKKELLDWGGLMAAIYKGGDRHGMLHGNASILITSYETITRDLEEPTCGGQRYVDIGVDICIIDEAQLIKDSGSRRSLVLTKLVAARRWALTGTPIENRPGDMSSILRWLFPNEFGDRRSMHDHSRLLAFRDNCLLRRTKAEVGLQLPPKTTSFVPTELSPDQASEYAQELHRMSRIIDVALDTKGRANLLAGIQNLRRICTISAALNSAKIDFIVDEIDTALAYSSKIVVFSSFPHTVFPALIKRLGQTRCAVYDGRMSPSDRDKAHERFLTQDDCTIMCASLRAAGVGITWTIASGVYHLDVWWNPQAMNQADDRVYRIGQKKPVWIKRLYAASTIEEHILDLGATKSDLFRLIVDEGGAPPKDQLDVSALRSLIRMKRLS